MQYIKTSVIILTALVIISCSSLPALAEVGFGFRGGMLIPDQEPFKDEFDSNVVFGGILEFDSNLGLVLEATVDYYKQDSSDSDLGGEITLVPIVVSAKYNFAPRYRTTPFVGLGVGAYFFDRDYGDGSSKTKTKYGTRVSGGIRFLEDRRMNFILEASRNFVDFDHDNASSFQIMLGITIDFYPSVVGAP